MPCDAITNSDATVINNQLMPDSVNLYVIFTKQQPAVAS